MENHFVLPKQEYKRDLDVIKYYIKDAATYLHKQTGKPLEQCLDFVRKTTMEGENPKLRIQDTPVLCLTRNQYGDREKEETTINEYIKDIVVNDRLVSPALTTYLNPETLPSLSATFIDKNISKRSKSKQEKLMYKQAGNELMTDLKENEQTSFKISNNSLSGAASSTGTILFNKSTHPSLTSTCRIATSYANANNEKFLYGNRHYFNPEIVKGNIISIINTTDYELLDKAMKMYNICHPTIEDTMECILRSSTLYWKCDEEVDILYSLVKSLSGLERSAFVYTGDMYHLAKHNDALVRNFLRKLSKKDVERVDNPELYINEMDNDMKAFVSLICYQELSGTTINDLKKTNYEAYRTIGSVVKQVIDTLDEYQFLIKALWRPITLPASVSDIKSIIRRGVLTSDTDSTIFTVQDWVSWYCGGTISFSDEAKNVSYAIVYLTTQNIIHILAKISAAMGVRQDKLSRLAMKNEFSFPVFALTTMTKHYFAYISAQEGNVFKELETEIKGVYLKDSNAPPHIMEEFTKTLKWVMDEVVAQRKIKVNDLLLKIATMEKDIEKSIRKGSSFYLARGQVKDRASYKTPDASPYNYYLFWQQVFAGKYGDSPEPPYPAVKVSLNLNNNTKIREWLDQIEDLDIKERMCNWVITNNKSNVTSMLLPDAIIENRGIPEEIIVAMDIRKLIYNTIKPFYILLETLGFFIINDNLTRLVSDFIHVE